jgi:D-glycero-D-manno-heptose 1,7-bisphosphate phosphatase
MQQQPAIFLDRDNTLNVDIGYTHKISDFRWVNGAPAALSLFTKAGLDVFIVTNQGGIGRGLFTVEMMHAFNEHLCAEAAIHGGEIKDIAFCPHHPDAITPEFRTPCDCRKPGHRMLTDLADNWSVDLSKSVMIGDRESDVLAGQAAGCHTYLFDGSDLHSLAKDVLATHFAARAGKGS